MSANTESGVVEAVGKELFIGGKWVAAQDGKTFPVVDPATGKELCHVADASPSDGVAALDAAVAAQTEFAKMAPRERGEILRRAYELLMRRQEELALLMTLEMGKPLAESKGEIAYAAEFFRWFAEEAVRIDGGYATAPNGAGRFLITKQPVGPTLLITPWNFPMAMGTRKIGPAIAAGCTAVIKPAAQTPLSMLALAGILAEAGLPEGVLNVVTTSDSGGVMEPLIRDGRARKLSFTGSTGVGRKLLEQCADKILRTSMELGGNAPFLVFDDADMDAAIEGAMQAKMRNIGEACTAANRFYVQRGVVDEFARRLTERMQALPMGRGTEKDVVVGPLIDEKAVDKVTELVKDATDRGARILTGGSGVDGPGHFYPATVLTDVPQEARLTHEEIFGPVAPITPFDTEEEAVAKANDTEFGLVSYLFTSDLKRALRVSEALEAGMIGLNQGIVSNPAAPFGGIKQSGLGREGGSVGIDEFLETKYIAVAL
ncbi:succinate-semialdehyde dehydrogenase (NADP+) [Amycolatopsis mediterranei S699]|uniref:Succinate-semialdehyde dehydrogenase (NADP+) n=2 Tax=Amycolatopsis mediterranei TaxID=33910 RepID=A0A0H3DHI8_AMYMU|nr:NAD-dependent succinate-semialdehyde dehydrogenase [Amycolatopsis mediterranei]ADJ49583.1 succinate-semialdehyde dehydrogenase (NADP+) [Amycolatopsis mediterranei U32]AEK46563.1 succinate-semialdehyde dehydrogenase (NADP+) [Amycolatopsis mediterranei S699]AFO81292.1 succinate-semialdehyde dehydrogenase (NADP+) [Amycolatopsis mediterranei S699]AGT88420.1 succinate-semialdehyde dehydrogenase (NADP+) [Amycolatopsis mediterranei RB]KDO12785.1 succinate-semialdehyde dehydrogenase [Amycolatopsis 